MTIQLKPEIERFIDEQVKAGHFASPAQVIEAAIGQLMLESADDLDEETLAAIDEAEAQYERGEGIPWEQVRQQLRDKYIGK